ncbi:hypothetical protein [uncultured Bacteroides sp.]|nr:hypothetical protein [uncultured Bacteroides sp.]
MLRERLTHSLHCFEFVELTLITDYIESKQTATQLADKYGVSTRELSVVT